MQNTGNRAVIRSSARIVCASLLAGAFSALPARGQTWSLDSASVTFEIRNAGLPVRGSFGPPDVVICFDPDRPETGSIIASIDPSTIETGIAMRDRHLKRRGYFDVAKFGGVEMRSIRLSQTGVRYDGVFELRIRDIVRNVEVPFDFEVDGERARVAGTLQLNRLDWGIGEKSLILSDAVTVTVRLNVTRGRSIDGPRNPCPDPSHP